MGKKPLLCIRARFGVLKRWFAAAGLWLASRRRLDGEPVGRAKASSASLVSCATIAGVGLLCQSKRPFFLSGEPSWGEEAALSNSERVEVEEEEGRFLDGVEVEANEVALDRPLEEDGVERKSVPKMSR